MKHMTLEQYLAGNPPPPPEPVAAPPVRPRFEMYEGGLKRTRPGPDVLAPSGALNGVARAFDDAPGKPRQPDAIAGRTKRPPAEVEVCLSYLLFISAVTRDAADSYRANCPCVEGEAISRFQALQDL